MLSRETSLKELRELDAQLHSIHLQLACHDLSITASLLTRCGGYILTRLKRIIEWGEQPHVDDTDLIGYSCRCIFEACLMLRHYGRRKGKEMVDLMKAETLRDDFDILESSIHFLGSPTPETQGVFDEYKERKTSLPTKTPSYRQLAASSGASEEYDAFYKLYSKYVHPSAYYLMGDHRQVHSGEVRDIFLDRAVIYAGYCLKEMRALLQNQNR